MVEKIEKNSKTLYQALWNSADILRSKMDANEYKSYLLGLVFYKYLSDNMLQYVSVLLEEETEDLQLAQNLYVQACEDSEIKEDLLDELQDEFSYTIEPQLTFTAQVNAIHDGSFQLEDLVQGFRDIEQSSEIFENLFEDIDLYSKKLGVSPQKQNKTIADVMKELSVLNMAGHAGDVLGDAYEYLIGQFASESGKKAGEFYTPQTVAKLMTQIVLQGKENQKGISVYDPTMGSGSLLLNAKRYSNEPGTISYFGQELNTSTYNLARMNMILHGVSIANQQLHNADTLDQDWPTEEPTNFDAVLMNPPYSANWSADKGFLEDVRFSTYGVLAPKSKADFAFLLHGYYHLKDTGVMAIVLPHGVLFRGGGEGKIRQILLENGAIDTVIGLPANIFFNTSIPTTVIILKKDRPTKNVLFIDASQGFEKAKNQNTLADEHIDAILEAYSKREGIEKYAYVAEFDEIIENDYNLNIPRYVDTFEEEEEISLKTVSTNIQQIKSELANAENELFGTLKELHGTTEESDKELQGFISQFMNNGDKYE
ncbi:type I restriction-modification system subunit M [Listeria monocytogenes]|nr:type I restriction-modification system subunit M [Listeria monocytogenes]EJB2521798.1 type I restriction-modification system subunit M [Listeria monocytogenes]EJB2690130.1 type I restriction-modification system subunit M [Listeria monocytogenes]EJE4582929.1 type I restriction-modification system subunit M [Listeria monocytogenes]EJE4647259.1 type I restriction-modification system subunit M [Listeria monocytogenes]